MSCLHATKNVFREVLSYFRLISIDDHQLSIVSVKDSEKVRARRETAMEYSSEVRFLRVNLVLTEYFWSKARNDTRNAFMLRVNYGLHRLS